MGCRSRMLRAAGLGLVLAVLWIPFLAQAQTFAEFFNQKKTQKRYLLKQIAALQVYLEYARKGYEVASRGISTIRDISNGEFDLHRVFLEGLKLVSPVVRDDARVAGVAVLQLEIVRQFSRLPLGRLPPEYRAYVAKVRAGVMEECGRDLDELLSVVVSGKLEMGEGERLMRLERVFLSMQGKADFVRGFSAEVNLMAGAKENGLKNVSQINGYYEN